MNLNPGQNYTLDQYANYFASKNIPTSYYRENNGKWLPLLPDKLGRRLDHIEMDYNLTLMNRGIAHFRVFSSGDKQLSGSELNSADKNKFLQFKYDTDLGEYYFTLRSVSTNTNTSGASGTSGTSGTSGNDGDNGTSGTSGVSASGSNFQIESIVIGPPDSDPLYIGQYSGFLNLGQFNNSEVNVITSSSTNNDGAVGIDLRTINLINTDFKAFINNVDDEYINLAFILPQDLASYKIRLIGLTRDAGTNGIDKENVFLSNVTKDSNDKATVINIVDLFSTPIKLDKSSKCTITYDKNNTMLLLESEWVKNTNQTGQLDFTNYDSTIGNNAGITT